MGAKAIVWSGSATMPIMDAELADWVRRVGYQPVACRSFGLSCRGLSLPWQRVPPTLKNRTTPQETLR